ncbi:HNH endonuclease [Nocardioides panacisoli]|uniref:HNH endonuclease signature motif containing protein n=1 Tax=Nocardioides panacisoli TaxID=627624 RepID=UPI001C63727D|nr:HNH endonuclease signature motif containing protein [Nocardioides panacisoli]QYJ03864.1 HNH endonuclease [Nocardioides panacisoli]
MSTQPTPHRGTAELLTVLRDHEDVKREAEVASVRTIVAWAEVNTVETPEDAATLSDGFVDTGVPIAGDGAPLVSEFALMELCAVLGRSTAGGREYVGKVLETAYRLPSVWQGVLEGRVPVWRAQRIADTTRLLSAEAAEYVDHHLATFAATCTFAQVDRLVEEALARFDPETAEERRREAAEGRRFDVHTDDAGIEGTVAVDGVLDVADALDLDAALAERATELAQLGCEESRDVRRSMAAGDLARGNQSLGLGHETGAAGLDTRSLVPHERGSTTKNRTTTTSRRAVDLHVHLTDTALTTDGVGTIGRLGNTRTPITTQQIRHWCSAPGTTIIVRPVIDLAGHEPIEAYEIPDRHHRQVRLRDPVCAFPHCNRRAERCDTDHAQPHADGGATCPCNLVPLCRGHHRAKTHSDWGYTILDPGTYLWTSPHGHQFLVDHRGTRDLDHDLDRLDHRRTHRH